MATGYSCPHCEGVATEVVDSRPGLVRGHVSVRRRRKCKACGLRFTTFEVAADLVRQADEAARLRRRLLRLLVQEVGHDIMDINGADANGADVSEQFGSTREEQAP